MFWNRLKCASSLIKQCPWPAESMHAIASTSIPLLVTCDFSSLTSPAINIPCTPTISSDHRQLQFDLRRQSSTSQQFEKHIIYRGIGIKLFRILVRLKIFQLTGIAAVAVPISAFITEGEVSHLQAMIAGGLVVGSGIASTALWYYSRRYVGELSLLKPLPNGNVEGVASRPMVRFSVLDFWGRREDNDVKVEDVIPPLEGAAPGMLKAAASEPVLPIQVAGDRQYIMSLRYGHILDSPKLQALLTGRDLVDK